jgi:hypothetical protein
MFLILGFFQKNLKKIGRFVKIKFKLKLKWNCQFHTSKSVLNSSIGFLLKS